MSNLEAILVFVNSVLSILVGAVILAVYPALREWIEHRIWRVRHRNDPSRQIAWVCGDDYEYGWTTIGYGKWLRS